MSISIRGPAGLRGGNLAAPKGADANPLSPGRARKRLCPLTS